MIGWRPRCVWHRQCINRTTPTPARPCRYRTGSLLCNVEFAIIGALSIWALLLRLPLFSTRSIGTSTLIIMGQGLLDGLRPTTGSESKPPLAFVAFAGAIKLLGATVAALRFGGYLCVVLTSYLVYRASYVMRRRKLSAFVAALVMAAMMSLLEPALMTELLCVVPLSAALLLLFRELASCPGFPGRRIGRHRGDDPHEPGGAGFGRGRIVIARPPLASACETAHAGLGLYVRPAADRGRHYNSLSCFRPVPVVVRHRAPRRPRILLESSLLGKSVKLIRIGFGIRSDGSTRHSVLLSARCCGSAVLQG